jgi:hypothetical protein
MTFAVSTATGEQPLLAIISTGADHVAWQLLPSSATPEPTPSLSFREEMRARLPQIMASLCGSSTIV